MGKYDARLNGLARKLDKLASAQASQAACCCGPIRLVHVEVGEPTPKLPAWRCKAHPRQVSAIVVHHSGQTFEEGPAAEAVEGLPGTVDGDKPNEDTGEDKQATFYIG